MKLDLVLDDEVLALGVNWLRKLGRNSMVSSFVLGNQTLVAFNALEDCGFLDRPGANVLPLLFRGLVRLLLRM